MKKIGHTYEELTNELKKNGWCYYENDQSWRAKAGDPLSEPVVTPEFLRNICEIHPALTQPTLNLLLAGHEIEVTVSQVGFMTAIVLQPRPILVSDDPPKFARPVKI